MMAMYHLHTKIMISMFQYSLSAFFGHNVSVCSLTGQAPGVSFTGGLLSNLLEGGKEKTRRVSTGLSN